MKKYLLITGLLLVVMRFSFGQNVGIGIATPHASAQLDISSTARGLLIPRMTGTGIMSIASPAKGLMVYDSLQNQLMVNMGTPAVPNWQTIALNSGWGLTGNSGTNPGSQFIGTTDNQPLRFRINNTVAGELSASGNVFWGLRAGQANANGYANLGMGTDALKSNANGFRLTAIGDSALFNGKGDGQYLNNENTAVGYKSLFANTNGSANTAVGSQSLSSNLTGLYNTAFGAQSLFSNTGNQNTAVGRGTLYSNGTGSENTAVGDEALNYNTTGSFNTGLGFGVLFHNSTGSRNTVTGSYAMNSNITGDDNTVTGYYAGQVSNGGNNTADGAYALYSRTSTPGDLSSNNTAIGANTLYNCGGPLSSFNTAVGSFALYNTTNSQFNTAIGYGAALSFDLGYNNTILGANCGVNQNGLFNCIAIGQGVICTSSSQARIGNSATNSIGGYASWSNISDGRYKKDVREDVKGIDFIMKLRPVTYHLDITGISNKLNENPDGKINAASRQAIKEKESMRFSGFVAQEVEAAAAAAGYDFSAVDKPKTDNEFYGLRYSEFVVPLVKAVQELTRKVERLEKENARLQTGSIPASGDNIMAQVNRQQDVINDLQQRLQLLEKQSSINVALLKK